MKRLMNWILAMSMLMTFSVSVFAGVTINYGKIHPGPESFIAGVWADSVTVSGTLTAPNYIITTSTNINASGYIVAGTSVIATNQVQGASLSVTGNVAGATLNISGTSTLAAITGTTASLTTITGTSLATGSGAITGGDITAAYSVNGATLNVSGASVLHALTATTVGATAVTATSISDTGALSAVGITNTGALINSYVLCSDSATLTASSATVVNCSRAGGQSIQLPAVASNTGLTFTFKKTGAYGIVTLLSNASETIDGSINNTSIKTIYDYLTITCTGSAWIIAGRYIQ